MRSTPDRPPYRWQVNRDASPDTETAGSSLGRRPEHAACRQRSALRVGARAGPAPTAAHAVPYLLAGQDSPRGVQRLYSAGAAATGPPDPARTTIGLYGCRVDDLWL